MQRWWHISPQTRPWCLLGYWALMFLMTHLPGIDRWRPAGGWFPRKPDQYVHFFAFAGWIGVWVWLLHGHGRRLTRISGLYLFIGGMAYATFDELTQAIVGRTPDWADWILDLSGLLAGLAVAGYLQTRRSLAAPGRGQRTAQTGTRRAESTVSVTSRNR